MVPTKEPAIEKLYRVGTGKSFTAGVDRFSWNINMLTQIVKFLYQIDLYVICPYRRLATERYAMDYKGVHFIFIKDESTPSVKFYLIKLLNRFIKLSYKKNHKLIAHEVNFIKPNVVHLIGAENVNYSPSILKLTSSIPVIVQLQTLMIDTDFKLNYPISNSDYKYRSSWELKVLKRANYIGCKSEFFKKIIKTYVQNDKTFIWLELPEGDMISKETSSKKEFDFEYHALDINKAADLAVEAFALAHVKHPEITLDIIGGYSDAYRSDLEARLIQLGISDAVKFEGLLPTHDDVIHQMEKARFSLLPLKIDYISSTVREAMAHGNPLLTTITPGTPSFNEKRESIMLSKIGDHQALADNMIKLIENPDYADILRANAFLTIEESCNHNSIIKEWVDAYVKISNI